MATTGMTATWTAAAAVAVYLLAIFPTSGGDYFVNFGRPLATWSSAEVSHWLVSHEFHALVPLFATVPVDGAMLEALTPKEFEEMFPSRPLLERKRLFMQIAQLKQELHDAALIASHWSLENYLHPCQATATQCERDSTLVSVAQLLVPRVTILWAGLCGRFLSEMPWKYRILWALKPHLAILHGELEAFGFARSLTSVLWHVANLFAAYFGPILEDFVLVLILSRVGIRGVTRLSPVFSILAHALCLVALAMDASLGWHVGGTRLLLSLYDMYALYGYYCMGNELRNQRESSSQ